MDKSINWKSFITIIGACIAFSIGSGFASGQEVMQFFTSYGYKSILVCIVFLVIAIYTACSFAHAGSVNHFEKGGQVFDYYCGSVIGRVFDIFTVIFCYMSFVVMVAGASSTITEQFGLPTWVGALLIAALGAFVVIFGFNSLVDIIGKVGPVLIVFIISIGIITLIRDGGQIADGADMLSSGQVTVVQAGSNWFTSGATYAGFVLLWNAGFVSQLAVHNKVKEVYYGFSLGLVIVILTGLAISFSMLANIGSVADAQIPVLVLANRIAPWLGVIFAVIIFLAIFSTACPLLWTAVSRFTKEKSKGYTIAAIALAAIGFVVAMWLPFSTLVNYIYGINGYAGFILMFFMIIKDIRVALANRKKSNE